MKKITLFLILICCFLYSCKKDNHLPALEIETYLDSTSQSYEGFKNNPIIRDSLNLFIKSDLPKQINSGIFDSTDFELKNIINCKEGYILQMEPRLKSKDYKHIKHLEINLEFLANTNKEIALKLEEGGVYNIKASFKNYLNLNNMNEYCLNALWAPFVGFKERSVTRYVELGSISVQLDSIY